MPTEAGKLYVFDALSTILAATPIAVGAFLDREDLGWIAAIVIFLAARLYIGFRAPKWLTDFLIERGYKRSEKM